MSEDAAEQVADESQPDLAKVKATLNLPETTSDVELITVLVNLIAALEQKYEALLGDAVKMEDTMTNRDLETFADVISNEAIPFWRGQILANRDATIAVLNDIRAAHTRPAAAPVAPKSQPSPTREPLRNRVVEAQRSINALVGAGRNEPAVAVKIRNRAAELTRSTKMPFAQAFAQAEKEITQE